MASIEFEQEIINLFVLEEKKERCLILLSTVKGRKKFRNKYLSNFQNILNPHHMLKIPPDQHSYIDIHRLLKQRGELKTCYIFSQNAKIDGQTMKFEEALQSTIGLGLGTLLYFKEERLAYYESEEPGLRYIYQT